MSGFNLPRPIITRIPENQPRIALIRLLENNDASPLKSLLHKLKYEKAPDPDVAVCCAHCLHPITYNRERIEVRHGSEHIFFNPHNLRFHIVCYKQAPGCSLAGIPTQEHTWFEGYDWNYALCGGCHEHLGWHYSATGNYFYGLIKDKLIEKQTD